VNHLSAPKPGFCGGPIGGAVVYDNDLHRRCRQDFGYQALNVAGLV
jgi:hypothetical protein